MAEILLAPPGAVHPDDRLALREAGVIVVEVEDPKACQFLRAGEVVSHGDMLWAAVDALQHDAGYGKSGHEQRDRFGDTVLRLITQATDPTTRPDKADS